MFIPKKGENWETFKKLCVFLTLFQLKIAVNRLLSIGLVNLFYSVRFNACYYTRLKSLQNYFKGFNL